MRRQGVRLRGRGWRGVMLLLLVVLLLPRRRLLSLGSRVWEDICSLQSLAVLVLLLLPPPKCRHWDSLRRLRFRPVRE